MSGYVMVMGACLVCRVPFSFNPDFVPSYSQNGFRQPICEGCMAEINAKRAEKGLGPFDVHLEAYAPCKEEELHG